MRDPNCALWLLLSVLLAASIAAVILVAVQAAQQPHHVTSYVTPRAHTTRLDISAPVPKLIWQTWHTKQLPPIIAKTVKSIQDAHPDFRHTLMDLNECITFIASNFAEEVVNAYYRLIPASYKADLWRYCVMYVHGGVYLDVKYECVPPFTFHQLLDDNHFVRDLPPYKHTYTAFFVCKPGDPRLLSCIHKIVDHVKQQYYGKTSLDPTGPGLLARYVRFNGPDVTMFKKGDPGKPLQDLRFVHDKATKAMWLRCAPGYKKEQNQFQNTAYYDDLWKQRKVYAP